MKAATPETAMTRLWSGPSTMSDEGFTPEERPTGPRSGPSTMSDEGFTPEERKTRYARARRSGPLLAAALWFGLPVPVQAQPANWDSPLCTNLADITDYSGEWPFVDAFKTSRPWVAGERWGCWDCAGPLDLDADGWVRSLNASVPNGGQVAHTILFAAGTGTAGTYTVPYDGEGTLVYGGGAQRDPSSVPGREIVQFNPANGDFLMTLVATNPANYLRNLRVIMPGGVCSNDPFAACSNDSACGAGTCQLFTSNYASQVFHPQFLANTRRYKVVRFMDWMGTNGSPVRDSVDYPEVSNARWRRVPVDVMIDLANRLDADVWVNVPHQATDAFVQALATRLRDRVEPGRRIWAEYSNEVWNGIFPQHAYAARRGCELYPDLQAGCDMDATPGNGVFCEGFPWPQWNASCSDALRRYYPRRSVEIFGRFSTVFGGTARLVRVIASQSGNTWLHRQYLSWNDAWQQTDVLATAPYVGGSYGGRPEVAGWTVDQLLADMLQTELPTALQYVADDRALLQQSYPALRLVSYEGGQHLVGVYGLENDPAMNALFDAANRDARMGALYTDYLDGWRSNSGQLFCHYVNVRSYSKWGRWGALERQDQSYASSPKYQALMSFIDDNPCWWPGCSGAPQDRIFADGFEGGTLSAWSAATADVVAASTAAALAGTWGMAVQVNDTAPAHVQDETPTDEDRYRVRLLRPSGYVPAHNTDTPR